MRTLTLVELTLGMVAVVGGSTGVSAPGTVIGTDHGAAPGVPVGVAPHAVIVANTSCSKSTGHPPILPTAGATGVLPAGLPSVKRISHNDCFSDVSGVATAVVPITKTSMPANS